MFFHNGLCWFCSEQAERFELKVFVEARNYFLCPRREKIKRENYGPSPWKKSYTRCFSFSSERNTKNNVLHKNSKGLQSIFFITTDNFHGFLLFLNSFDSVFHWLSSKRSGRNAVVNSGKNNVVVTVGKLMFYYSFTCFRVISSK